MNHVSYPEFRMEFWNCVHYSRPYNVVDCCDFTNLLIVYYTDVKTSEGEPEKALDLKLTNLAGPPDCINRMFKCYMHGCMNVSNLYHSASKYLFMHSRPFLSFCACSHAV